MSVPANNTLYVVRVGWRETKEPVEGGPRGQNGFHPSFHKNSLAERGKRGSDNTSTTCWLGNAEMYHDQNAAADVAQEYEARGIRASVWELTLSEVRGRK